MGFLCAPHYPRENTRVRRYIFRSIFLADEFPGFRHRGVRHVRGIGTHISDQTHRFFFSDRQTFIKLLRQHHRLFCGEAAFIPGFLLQCAGDEWRRRLAQDFFHFDRVHGPFRFFQVIF